MTKLLHHHSHIFIHTVLQVAPVLPSSVNNIAVKQAVGLFSCQSCCVKSETGGGHSWETFAPNLLQSRPLRPCRRVLAVTRRSFWIQQKTDNLSGHPAASQATGVAV